MTDRARSEPLKDDSDEQSDLVDRLANYRLRVIREGRKAALEKIDRAIEEARQPKKAKR